MESLLTKQSRSRFRTLKASLFGDAQSHAREGNVQLKILQFLIILHR